MFNANAVYATTQKTMLGPDVADSMANLQSVPDIESLLPQFKVFKILPIDAELSSTSLSSIGCLVATDHGLWALVNTSPSGDREALSSEELIGWEEDQVGAVVVSYEWIQCGGMCDDPDGNPVYLQNLTVRSVVQSEDDEAVFYLGTQNGMFRYKISGTGKFYDQDTDMEVWTVDAGFNRIYGNYDASISSMVYVHPEGYTGSVLAGTDYGVLQAANGWFPNSVNILSNWVSGINYDSIVGVGLNNLTPAIVATSAMIYKVNPNSSVTQILEQQTSVYGIYEDDSGWLVLLNGPYNDVQLIWIDRSNINNRQVVADVPNTGWVKKHMMSDNGNIYFTDTVSANILYKISKSDDGTAYVVTELSADGAISSFTVTACEEFDWMDVPIVATQTTESLYAFLPNVRLVSNQFMTRFKMDDGDGVNVVGHGIAPNSNLNLTFCQKNVPGADDNGTYVVRTSDLEHATSNWTKVNDTTELDSTISIIDFDGIDVMATRGGLFLIGVNNDDGRIWTGSTPANPDPILNGSFRGVAKIDNPDNTSISSGNPPLFMLLVEDSGVLDLYGVNLRDDGTSEFKLFDSLSGINSGNIVDSPLNGPNKLSCLVIHDDKMNGVFATRNGVERFDTSTVKPVTPDIQIII